MPGVLRPLLLLLVTGGALAAVSAMIRPAVPWPAGFEIRQKLEAFEEVKDECELLYFGSSYVYRSFRPDVIDEELARQGFNIRSFNLGVGGMDAFETDHLLREVLAMQPASLRWVVIEPRPFTGRIATMPNAFTERSVRWHTLHGTREALRSVWLAHQHPIDKLADAWVHLRLFARRFGNFGLGATLLSSALGVDDEPELKQLFVEDQGYLALDGLDVASFKQRRRALLKNTDRYWEDVNSLPKRNTAAVDLAAVNVSAFASQAAVVRSVGAEQLAVAPPGLLASPIVFALWKSRQIMDVMWFNIPKQFPDLYDVAHRFDSNHLNREGAEIFSRLFAETVSARLSLGSAAQESD